MGETEMSARMAGQRELPVDGGAPPVIDAAFARWLADRAGQVLLRVREDIGYSDAKALKAAGDKAAHDLLRAELARWRPADAVLSEESFDDKKRLGRSRVWIIDPLDGTREYSEGRDDWAVHVALAIDGLPKIGAVAVPLILGRALKLPPEQVAILISADLFACGVAFTNTTASDAGKQDLPVFWIRSTINPGT